MSGRNPRARRYSAALFFWHSLFEALVSNDLTRALRRDIPLEPIIARPRNMTNLRIVVVEKRLD
jgi:hypothetical protein